MKSPSFRKWESSLSRGVPIPSSFLVTTPGSLFYNSWPSGFCSWDAQYSFFSTRQFCKDLTSKDWFDFIILTFIAANCITLAVERPTIPPWWELERFSWIDIDRKLARSRERSILRACNTLFSCVFTVEMVMKAVANGFILGKNNYFSDNWNRLDGTLVLISLVDGVIRMVAGKLCMNINVIYSVLVSYKCLQIVVLSKAINVAEIFHYYFYLLDLKWKK